MCTTAWVNSPLETIALLDELAWHQGNPGRGYDPDGVM